MSRTEVLSERPASSLALNRSAVSSTVDMCSASDNKICQRIKEQSEFRDQISKDTHWAYLNCADGKPLDCGTVARDSWFAEPPMKVGQISDQVAEVLQRGDFTQSLARGDGMHSLFKYLEGWDSPTSRAPLQKDRHSSFELASRPYESPLIDELSKTTGTIKHSQLMATALKVTNNDRTLAILTLANFTKSMASIERRQMAPENIAPALRDAYKQDRVDSIFNRIEGFADDPAERYNKEGAIYHFYGAMFAASQIGPVSALGTSVYNSGKLFLDKTTADAVKAAAGSAGAQYLWGMTPAELNAIPYYSLVF